MGLVLNEHGFLSRTTILPGNASEPKILEEMIENLSAHQSLLKPTIILDAEIATEENLAWLRSKGYHYVVSARQNAPSFELESTLTLVDDLHDQVKVALIKTEGNEEQWLYCESEAKAVVALEMKQSFRRRFEEELNKLSAGLSKLKGKKIPENPGTTRPPQRETQKNFWLLRSNSYSVRRPDNSHRY